MKKEVSMMNCTMPNLSQWFLFSEYENIRLTQTPESNLHFALNHIDSQKRDLSLPGAGGKLFITWHAH